MSGAKAERTTDATPDQSYGSLDQLAIVERYEVFAGYASHLIHFTYALAPMTPIIATRADLDALALTDPAAHAAFLRSLRASLTTTLDVAEYPDDYDRTLTPADAGYIAPVIEVRATPETAARFGYTPEELAGAQE